MQVHKMPRVVLKNREVCDTGKAHHTLTAQSRHKNIVIHIVHRFSQANQETQAVYD